MAGGRCDKYDRGQVWQAAGMAKLPMVWEGGCPWLDNSIVTIVTYYLYNITYIARSLKLYYVFEYPPPLSETSQPAENRHTTHETSTNSRRRTHTRMYLSIRMYCEFNTGTTEYSVNSEVWCNG